jgi:anti-anti-sigma regulatory factor
MHFEIEVSPHNTLVRPVLPEGSLDDFRPKQTVAKLVTSGTQHIVFDLARIDLLDARGLGQIIGAMVCALEHGTRFTLRNVSSALIVQLTDCKLNDLIEIESPASQNGSPVEVAS